MKKHKIRKACALALCMMVAAGSFKALPVSAGLSKNVLNDDTFQENLDTRMWNNPDERVRIEKGILIFPAESTEETKLITKTAAKQNSRLEMMVTADITLKLAQLPENQKFILAFGLGNVEATQGEPGNIEAAFWKDGGLKVSVTAYDESGQPVKLAESVNVGSLNRDMKLWAAITMEERFSFKVDGKTICDAELPVSGEGRIGFLQKGSCEAQISHLEITYYKYDTPENCDISEDFESGSINKALLTSKTPYKGFYYYPSVLEVQEYEGSKVLMFCNTNGAAYIGTTHKYSNFELTVDVPYMSRSKEMDEEGNVIRAKCSQWGISFGDEAADYDSYGYESSADMVLLRPDSSIVSMNRNNTGSNEAYPFFDASCNKPFSLKLSVIDGVVTVFLKWMEETDYTQILTYELDGQTPTGYVHIWTTGTGMFALDNLKIVNKDKEPVLTEVSYESGAIEVPEDFAYEPEEKVYAEEETEKQESESSFNWYLLIPVSAGASAIGLLTVVVILQLKRKKKEVGMDEKK